uniref:Uncharacterized protein n=1 Tax=Cacopsylla melanoneura TaxID=428564 RepID=A0A8D9EMI2_9HEMI
MKNVRNEIYAKKTHKISHLMQYYPFTFCNDHEKIPESNPPKVSVLEGLVVSFNFGTKIHFIRQILTTFGQLEFSCPGRQNYDNNCTYSYFYGHSVEIIEFLAIHFDQITKQAYTRFLGSDQTKSQYYIGLKSLLRYKYHTLPLTPYEVLDVRGSEELNLDQVLSGLRCQIQRA